MTTISITNPNTKYTFDIDIYTLEELEALEMTPELLECFYDTESLLYSTIFAMWRFIGNEQPYDELVKIMQNDEHWFKKNTWSKEQRFEFTKRLLPIYMKCLDMDKESALENIEEFMAFGYAFDLEDLSDSYFESLVEMLDELYK